MSVRKQTAYKQPFYYEIAFSFIDAKKQVDLFENFIEKYSEIKVKRFLDIGCGPSLQLREIARRGYEAVGLDSCPEMLKYLNKKAEEEGVRLKTVKADLRDFKLEKKVDFAFIMMGTISYVDSNYQLLVHLDSVADSLKKGGLYLIENFRLDWASEDFFGPESWTMEKDGIRVKTIYDIQLKDALMQTITETMRLEVDDHGEKSSFEEIVNTKIIFPQEFLTLVQLNGRFEFIGWFERHRLKKLTKANMDNITILRKR
jgi:SAM-dependent methyltransferase